VLNLNTEQQSNYHVPSASNYLPQNDILFLAAAVLIGLYR